MELLWIVLPVCEGLWNIEKTYLLSVLVIVISRKLIVLTSIIFIINTLKCKLIYVPFDCSMNYHLEDISHTRRQILFNYTKDCLLFSIQSFTSQVFFLEELIVWLYNLTEMIYIKYYYSPFTNSFWSFYLPKSSL